MNHQLQLLCVSFRHAGGRYLSMSSSRSRIFDDVWRGRRKLGGAITWSTHHVTLQEVNVPFSPTAYPLFPHLPGCMVKKKNNKNENRSCICQFMRILYLYKHFAPCPAWLPLNEDIFWRNINITQQCGMKPSTHPPALWNKHIFKKKNFNCMPWRQELPDHCLSTLQKVSLHQPTDCITLMTGPMKVLWESLFMFLIHCVESLCCAFIYLLVVIGIAVYKPDQWVSRATEWIQ